MNIKGQKSDQGKDKEKEAAKKEAANIVKATTTTPLKVEIHFPFISDLKQAIAIDTNGRLVMAIQFKAVGDQYEIFRLANLLKQPHTNLYATIGTQQSAMDFKFTKDGKVEILKAQVAANRVTEAKPEPKPNDKGDAAEIEKAKKPVKIHNVTFNHITEEKLPYGVVIDYVLNGTGEIVPAAGRGKNPMEAVIKGVKQCGAVPADIEQPFEISAALQKLESTPATNKLIRVLESGSFDINEGGKSDTKEGG